ncbi:hypothetical protein H6G54_22675 [Anabaena cylindrica FACHB-243]|nr:MULTISPECIES: hypothetical protein [Anabaena]MBD2420458.1 hypothetical protein [Anabaena cylindrica FACHB-243]MBY5282386.1 hypothetical protein [Anabaena sp. CCAP 1446/1C]MBY5306312.1 hypothetical protein [Anabaena sp. CCAP 1446/1C]MCM2406916.1 hypothetical protein [Anabaena sp. CCAP 1446/1C]
MSLLTDTDLEIMKCYSTYEWQNQSDDQPKIYIDPFSPNSLTPIGYDLRVGGSYMSASKGEEVLVNQNSPVIIEPGDTTLITVFEEIRMPKNHKFSGLILSKVSKVSKGLSNISTTIDPDWVGHLVIAVHNFSQESITINFKDTFCTVVFLENKSPSTKESRHTSGRNDILRQRMSEAAKKVQRDRDKEKSKENKQKKKKKETENFLQVFSSLGIILIFIVIGYVFFKQKPDIFITTIGVGVAISQTALIVITNIFNSED